MKAAAKRAIARRATAYNRIPTDADRSVTVRCVPAGACYVMTNIRGVTDLDDVAFAEPADGRELIRFCFAKRVETLERAADALRRRLG
jgi:aspartate/methionine/tyrosine aminotransferase